MSKETDTFTRVDIDTSGLYRLMAEAGETPNTMIMSPALFYRISGANVMSHSEVYGNGQIEVDSENVESDVLAECVMRTNDGNVMKGYAWHF